MTQQVTGQWPRIIALVDMNAFFASIEQQDHPEWRGRPVAITNGKQGTCIITCSYEARKFGIKTGMRLKEARHHCPELIQVPSHPRRYTAVSTAIMESLSQLTPDMEIFSVDEAFLDFTSVFHLYSCSIEQLGELIKQCVWDASGILCSVGISGDKTTAKYAAKLNKPDGLTVISPRETRQRLATAKVTELCGIGKGIGHFLEERGVITCGDMQRLPIGTIAKRFGNPGRRIWLMAQGLDPAPVETTIAAPKTIGHGKVMPPNTTDKEVILTYLQHMSHKIVARLRRHDMKAQKFSITLKTNEGWIGNKYKSIVPTNDIKSLNHFCHQMLREEWRGNGVHQCQITALDPKNHEGQLDMFAANDDGKQQALNKVMDNINERYGEFALAPARLVGRSEMPNVIAPAWKPHGHRQTIR
ncbi:MAG: DNA polymerase IV [Proteobacteria bacterium]|nr:DNA polymerase IV [Pseudomonadota bacterium]